jgi:hypothetical protein
MPDNPFHVHAVEPQDCDACRDKDSDDELDDVGAIVTSVLRSIAPQVPGLRVERSLVHAATTDAVAQAVVDPELFGLAIADWRRVVAGRVRIALTFSP